MTPSPRLYKFLEEQETFNQFPYPDGNGFSIGFGHFIKKGEDLKKVNTAQAREILKNDVAEAATEVNKLHAPLNQNQFDALVSLVYNIGITKFRKSQIRKFLHSSFYEMNAPKERYLWASEQFHRWNKVTINGAKRISNGLIRRRLIEAEWFNEKELEHES